MGLFSKVFSKKEEKEKLPEEEPFYFDSPYCRFHYMSAPAANAFGYEGEIQTSDDGQEFLTVYLDTDSPQTLDANICYARLENMLSGREDMNYEIRKSMTDYFLSRPELVSESSTEAEIFNGFVATWLGIFRNGEIQLSFNSDGIYAGDIEVLLKADGTKEIKYDNYHNHEKQCDNL